jgi:hypothetical protein
MANHVHEHLARTAWFYRSYTWAKLCLQTRGLLEPAPGRGAHRRRDPRRPLPGMMLHQDASRHAWVSGLPACDLAMTLDDATSVIDSALMAPVFAAVPGAVLVEGDIAHPSLHQPARTAAAKRPAFLRAEGR